MTYPREAAALAAKDLRVDLRTRHTGAVLLPFAVTLLVAFGLAFGPGRAALTQAAPGMLWLAALFAAVLAAERGQESEQADDAQLGLVLAPVPKGAVFTGKAVALTVQLIALQAGLVLLGAVLFELPVTAHPGVLAIAVAGGSAGLGALGVLFGGLAGGSRTRSGVLPLLVLALAAPLLLAAVRTTSAAFTGVPAGDWPGLLVTFDVVFWSLGTLLYEPMLED